jgi:glutamate-1-semialdehyde aminotransferase
MCLLVKTGSDATSAAVRLARMYTGRDKVLRWGYNGWHDWSVDQEAGIPRSVRAESEEFDFYDLGALQRLLSDNTDNVACVLTMPFWEDEVDPMHLASIRDLAHLNGALFVLDEMRSGFRVALGGAQEFFGLQADLAAYGKAMGNGHPISAVVGRRELLLQLSETKISSTFFADPGPMAAAIATIQILEDTDALATIWETGQAFKAELVRLSSHLGDLVQVVGYPPMPFMRFNSEASKDDPSMVQRFVANAAAHGALLHPDHQWFLSAAHDAGVIDQALTAIETALMEI